MPYTATFTPEALTRAGVEDIARVEGINKELAQRIYDAFHEG